MKLWAILFGLMIVAIVIAADTDHLGFLGRIYDFPYGDKVGHFLIFGLMSLLANLAVFEARLGRGLVRLALKTSLVLALLIGFEEFSQRWFPLRMSSALDLAASYLGVAVFAWLAVQIAKRRQAKRTV